MAGPKALTEPARATGLSTTSETSYSPSQTLLMAVLAETAILRDAEASQGWLHSMTVRLSREDGKQVLEALKVIAEQERRQGEPSLPTLGMVLREMRRQSHPLKHLREIISKLAEGFGQEANEEMLTLYQDTAGHRTDEDLDRAYRVLREDENLRKMPSPGRFLAACGIPKVYRNGTRPE